MGHDLPLPPKGDDRYTIHHHTPCIHVGGLILGDIYILQGDGGLYELVGDYCAWPKQEPRYFRVIADD